MPSRRHSLQSSLSHRNLCSVVSFEERKGKSVAHLKERWHARIWSQPFFPADFTHCSHACHIISDTFQMKPMLCSSHILLHLLIFVSPLCLCAMCALNVAKSVTQLASRSLNVCLMVHICPTLSDRASLHTRYCFPLH